VRERKRKDPAQEAVEAGFEQLCQHHLFAELARYLCLLRPKENNPVPDDGWALVSVDGSIHAHPRRRAEPGEWLYVFAHAALHLIFGHFRHSAASRSWNAACDCVVSRFLIDLKLGTPIAEPPLDELHAWDESRWFNEFQQHGIPPWALELSIAGPTHDDMRPHTSPVRSRWHVERDWARLFSAGMLNAVDQALQRASGVGSTDVAARRTPAQRARAWFIDHYPLLGALAAGFELLEDSATCQKLAIAVAAISDEERRIYLNPGAGLSEEETRFVIAHELLHAGLRHSVRCAGRDFFLWNVACDFVINGWLIEMGVGEPPARGLLHDPALRGQSAETIYDMIGRDLRTRRRLVTLRGQGSGDMLDGARAAGASRTTDLDSFCRRALLGGLEMHLGSGRGLLPAGLVEEIRALAQPPIPWDVALAQWFDGWFAPLERTRTYARLSRRQSSTPDIPRPRYVLNEALHAGRTFGVVLDSSGSMARSDLARALGAAAAYAMSREVQVVRLVCCDAAAHDEGYLPAEAIAGAVKVRGRGGTVLQPAVNLLSGAEDFPKAAPILIITDGGCEPNLKVPREHAFLLTRHGRLPFAPRGPVFRMV
jgi:predicted metal-dependent peptidase